ncbi:hypothetical protein SAMN05216474_3034 [Lishizhenia tianjinensis]|uniref:Uncharacterized protein n=1 Tax=Lishizhenia tianjinensis TaxID=477690 RepID=A0A1I7BRT4_9FLAO|nr:hypothetical protein [Lishizhenia tianjinensis]SFT89899.1 hypothetical protein SAMN05216474_3034 [Lishizhenia tianjinensis]
MAANPNKYRPYIYLIAGVLLTIMVIIRVMDKEAELDAFDYMQMVVGPLATVLGIVMLKKSKEN